MFNVTLLAYIYSVFSLDVFIHNKNYLLFEKVNF